MLHDVWNLGRIELKNRVVMAPMTRCRALGNVANALMAEYYRQRADAGLIITEGTSPSPNGLGYARIPGLFTEEQATGWRLVTDAVHTRGGRIFVQLMHTGRVAHPANLPPGGRVLAPSAIVAPGQMYSDKEGMQPHPQPAAMSEVEIEAAIEEYVRAATLAVNAAGFDGVELHGANGYLIDQFLNANSNIRADKWGGSAENRNRFAREIITRTRACIGADRVAIRISPFGASGGMGAFEGIEAQYLGLAQEIAGIAYLHFVDHSSMGAPPIPDGFRQRMRDAFEGTFILSGGYDAARAENDLRENKGDLVAFGRPFISNPTLVDKLRTGAALTAPVPATFYTPDAVGYTDYV